MSDHFCTCTVENCQNNPRNHDKGCDPCIKKNLANDEIPVCFWRKVSDDLSGVKRYKMEDFVKFYASDKKM